jgi:hypothetical protein
MGESICEKTELTPTSCAHLCAYDHQSSDEQISPIVARECRFVKLAASADTAARGLTDTSFPATMVLVICSSYQRMSRCRGCPD